MLLYLLFFCVALLYASAGLGGGSTYNALLILFDVNPAVVPIIALTCNLVVVIGGTWNFWRAGHLGLGRIIPWLWLSVPLSWLGGSLAVSQTFYVGLLATFLALSGAYMLWPSQTKLAPAEVPSKGIPSGCGYLPFFVGGVLGFCAGVKGIGGGILLAPFLYLSQHGNAKQIAASCSFFIMINSAFGLMGQLTKFSDQSTLHSMLPFVWLGPIVLLGGLIGSNLGARLIKQEHLRLITGILVLYVAIRLYIKLWPLLLGG